MRFVVYVCVFLFIPGLLLAQGNKDTLRINEVAITRQGGSKNLQKLEVIDSVTLAQNSYRNLGELLTDYSTIYLKNYGAGASSTISFRGTNASQTRVNWNGIPVNSPMMGLVDFSLIPVSGLDQVQIRHGGSSAEAGSGAIGGLISLETRPDFSPPMGVTLGQGVGSFGRYAGQLGISLGRKRWSSRTVLSYLGAKNDFEYINRAEFRSPVQKQNNAEVLQYGFSQSFFYQPSVRSLLSLHMLYQWSDRNIGSPMFNRNNVSTQEDHALRNSLSYQYTIHAKWLLNTRLGYSREYIRFQNRIRSGPMLFVLLDAKSHSDMWVNTTSISYLLRPQTTLKAGYEAMYEGATTEDYGGFKERNRGSLFANLQSRLNSFTHVVLNVRQEFANVPVPFAWQASSVFRLIRKPEISLKLSGGQDYHLPTLNDLFWKPGGNPELKPERSIGGEASLLAEHSYRGFQSYTELTGYHAVVYNWILWQPSAIESGNWSPQNLREVLNEGFEITQRFGYTHGRWKTGLKLLYAYTIARNQKAVAQNDESLGKQLIYVPFENARLSYDLSYGNLQFAYLLNYTGYRFTTSDNEQFQPGYSLHQVMAGYQWNYKKQALVTRFRVENLLDTSYETVPFRAMPGRSYLIDLQLKINTKSL